MVRELFNEMDSDGGGYLDREEVAVLFKKIGMTMDAQVRKKTRNLVTKTRTLVS